LESLFISLPAYNGVRREKPLDQKESFYEHVAERREQGRRVSTRPGERGCKASSGRFLDNCVDPSKAEETQESDLALKLRGTVAIDVL